MCDKFPINSVEKYPLSVLPSKKKKKSVSIFFFLVAEVKSTATTLGEKTTPGFHKVTWEYCELK